MRLWAGALEVEGVVKAVAHTHTQMHIYLYEQTHKYSGLYISDFQPGYKSSVARGDMES